MIAADTETSVRGDQIPGKTQPVFGSGELHDIRKSHREKLFIVAVAGKIDLPHRLPVQDIFRRDFAGQTAFRRTETFCVLQSFRTLVHGNDLAVSAKTEQRNHAEPHVTAADNRNRVARSRRHHLDGAAEQTRQRLHNRVLVLQIVRHMTGLHRIHDDILLISSAAEPGDAVARLESLNVPPRFGNDSDRLMSENLPLFRDAPRIPLRMTHPGVRDFDQKLIVREFRHRHFYHAAFARSLHYNLFHIPYLLRLKVLSDRHSQCGRVFRTMRRDRRRRSAASA